MAHFRKKPDGRCRVQFTLDCELHRRYVACRNRAKKLRYSIEFGSDFEAWFAGEIQEVERQLDEMERGFQDGGNIKVSTEDHDEF